MNIKHKLGFCTAKGCWHKSQWVCGVLMGYGIPYTKEYLCEKHAKEWREIIPDPPKTDQVQ